MPCSSHRDQPRTPRLPICDVTMTQYTAHNGDGTSSARSTPPGPTVATRSKLRCRRSMLDHRLQGGDAVSCYTARAASVDSSRCQSPWSRAVPDRPISCGCGVLADDMRHAFQSPHSNWKSSPMNITAGIPRRRAESMATRNTLRKTAVKRRSTSLSYPVADTQQNHSPTTRRFGMRSEVLQNQC